MPSYLFKDGNNIKDINLNTIGTAPVTESMFTNYGFALSSVTDAKIRALTNPEIIGFDTTSSNKTLTIDALPQAKVILNNTDYTYKGLANIDFFSITASISGTGSLRIILSTDQGVTWKTYNSGWQVLNSISAANVASQGMTASVLNNISSADWNSLLGADGKIRFGYYLNINDINDVASINTLLMRADNDGEWTRALKTQATYKYFSTKIKTYMYANGNYKINY